MISDFPQSLPHSEEAERAVLGAVLLKPEVLADLGLEPEHFYPEKHQVIFEAMQHLSKSEYGGTVDTLTVNSYLEAEGKLDIVGGLAYLAQLDLDLPDVDRVGVYAEIVLDRHRKRQAIMLGSELIRAALDQPGNGNGHFPAAVERISASLAGLSRKPKGSTLASAQEATDAAWEWLDAGELAVPGVTTGLPAVDALIGAMQPGHLWLIGAEASVGKTVLGAQCAWREARRGGGVVIFALEGTARELTLRQAAAETSIPYSRLDRRQDLKQPDFSVLARWLQWASTLPLWIEETPELGVDQVAARVRELQDRTPISLVMIDYLGLMRRPGGRDSYRGLEMVAQGLQAIAKDLKATTLVMHQLNKLHGRKPTLADLQEAGHKEAHGVILLDRPHLKDKPALRDLIGTLTVAKNRGGETGEIPIRLDGPFMRFREVESYHRIEPEPRERERYV